MLEAAAFFDLLRRHALRFRSLVDAADQTGAASQRNLCQRQRHIRLQNLKTRIIVVCRESFYETAETCAQFYEKNNYVRLTDIPYKVAKYDRLTKDTFPTRRWRNGERTPRW